jgi:hypothetical protein
MNFVNGRLLGIYLNDHLAGATGGLELARRAARNNRDGKLAADLERLVQEIDQDRATLVSIMERLGVAQNPVKTSGAWLLEKVGRLKLNGSAFGYSPLSRIEELETLAAGVEAKKAMWLALKRVRDRGADIGDVDLDALVARAQRQKRLLDRRRLEAVAAAFEE